MSFTSLHFLLFFPIVTALYFALPYRSRWLLLLLASCYFYMAFVPVYILILGRARDAQDHGRAARRGRARRDEGATLGLVTLHDSAGLVVHPVDQRALTAVGRDGLILVGQLVEGDQNPAAGTLAKQGAEERTCRR